MLEMPVRQTKSGSKMVRSYGLRQEFVTPHCPQRNGMMERLIRLLKEQCVYRQRFDSFAHASHAMGDWVAFYNPRRPHKALGMKTPAAAFELPAQTAQTPPGRYSMHYQSTEFATPKVTTIIPKS
ncbi:integrase core domain-containing protein [uncultured Jannaschia sp.]|uniref:integrase core domain-containing protein n=1 Tax=uncultured Jannaschia sp. TaxID=293347 RepID=UPI00261DF937|nr:integrase core domain-containing protein [uncultured Jannaschia sp.]